MSQQRFVYAGARRNTISFPLGGIGAGCIGLDGTGHLIDWEIYNKPNKGSRNGFTHFALKASDGGRTLDARVLHADVPKPYMGGSGGGSFGGFGFGVDRYTMTGVPHFPDCVFTGKFPFAELDFLDDGFPGSVRLTAFNPLIPTNEDDSSIPAAFLAYTIVNTTDRPLDYTLAGSLNNPFAAKSSENRYTAQGGVHCLTACDRAHDPADFAYGDLTLATDAEDVCVQEYWFRGAWFDNINLFWQDFTADGRLQNRRYPYDPADQTPREDVGTLAAHFRLQPGASRTVRFVISWNVPNNQNYWNPLPEDQDAAPAGCCGDGCRCGGAANKGAWKNYYATLFTDSRASAGYALRNWERLERDTRLFADALFSSTLPEAALDAVSATLSVLKSPTVLRLEDGSLYGWEGCHCDCGCCEGSCSHVWAYTYALPFLFPRLERSMRDLEFAYTQGEDGGLSFRLQLPLGRARWAFRPCADGQFATVFKTYRDYKICGDRQWLADKWPQVQKAVAYAWSDQNADRWDPDRSGVLTGRQHHTLDMELFGPNSWLESMYLAALRACEEMARALGEESAAETYHAIFAKGSAWSNEHLFNGEYFCQNIDLHDRTLLERYKIGDSMVGDAVTAYWNSEQGEIKYQIGEGSAIDQVLGQWHANLIGLGELFDRDKVRSALRSIYRYNYRPSMRGFFNPCRLYCVDDEAGTLICAYPEDRPRPAISAPYAEETMHGFEYQAAIHMIQEGMVDEGMRLVEAVRDRYDGERRNPWNEMECGSNYARSMAAFALLPAFSGMTYDLSRGLIGFAPVVPGDFRCFWSLDTGFGTVELSEGEAVLRILYGSLPVRRLRLPVRAAAVEAAGRPIGFTRQDQDLLLEQAVTLRAGEALRVV